MQIKINIPDRAIYYTRRVITAVLFVVVLYFMELTMRAPVLSWPLALFLRYALFPLLIVPASLLWYSLVHQNRRLLIFPFCMTILFLFWRWWIIYYFTNFDVYNPDHTLSLFMRRQLTGSVLQFAICALISIGINLFCKWRKQHKKNF